MRLERLAAQGFRNLEPFELGLDSQFIVFHGDNAQGKTNALEAIWFAATLRGLRSRRHRDLIRWGEREAVVVAEVRHQGISRQFRVELGGGQRKALLDGKPVNELADYFEGIRAIAFSPDDGAIVTGEPGRRRAWLDRAAFTSSPAHLELVRTYRRTLEQKSALLRQENRDLQLLDVLDEGVATHGALLVHRRVSILEELAPHIIELHASIAGSDELTLRYRTTANGSSLQERRQALASRISDVRERELHRQTTLAGPQLDDLDIRLQGRSARTYGSRGQVRSLVLALKLAELRAARERSQTPLFLLDDLSSELDLDRTHRLVEVLIDLDAQVLLSTTVNAPSTFGLPVHDTQMIQVESGQFALDSHSGH